MNELPGRDGDMDDLPQGWVQAQLASLIANDGLFADGDWVESKDQDPTGSIRLLQLADIGDGVFVNKSNRFINEGKFRQLRCTEVLEGDVLIARMPDPLGRACLAPKLKQKSITVVDVAILRPGKKSVWPKWLLYSINSPQLRSHIGNESSGTTRKRIARGKLSEMSLAVPPLPEQKRIADKVEMLLARVDACRSRLDRLPDLLKRFRQSVLAAATSGQLTEGRKEADALRATVPLREAVTTIRTGPFGSSLHKADYVTGGTPIVNPMHINLGKIKPTNEMTVDEGTLARLSEFKLRAGEVIIGRRGEMGRCAVVTTAEDGWLCGTGSIVLSPSAHLHPHYLQIFLSSPATVQALEGESVGSTMVNLNQRILLDLDIFYPPLPEQQEIVRRVEELFAFADRIEAGLTNARTQVDRLTPSVLAKAFRGELVPQNPNDEPASVLLERLRAQVGTAGGAAKKRRGFNGAAKAAAEPEPELALHSPAVAKTTRAAASTAKPAPPQTAARQPATDITSLDKNDLMALLREVLADQGPCDRDTLIQQAAYALGYKRTGSVITTELDNAIRTAVRRCIILKDGAEFRVNRAGIAEMEADDRDFMKDQFLACISQGGKVWIEREDAPRLLAHWFGFRRTGHQIQDRVKSLINGLLRDQRLDAKGRCIRRV